MADDGPRREEMRPRIETPLRNFIKDELRGVYTVSFVIVESVDESTRRAEVSHKSDQSVLIDNVPIASPFATDGGGLIAPISRNDEGLLLHAKEPSKKKLRQHGELSPDGERRFPLESAFLVPLLWLDDDDVPDHEDGEFQIALPGDGSVFRLLPDGRTRLEHSSGNVIAMDETGHVSIGDEDAATSLLQSDVTIEYEDTQDDGSVVTKEATVDADGTGSTDDLDAS